MAEMKLTLSGMGRGAFIAVAAMFLLLTCFRGQESSASETISNEGSGKNAFVKYYNDFLYRAEVEPGKGKVIPRWKQKLKVITLGANEPNTQILEHEITKLNKPLKGLIEAGDLEDHNVTFVFSSNPKKVFSVDLKDYFSGFHPKKNAFDFVMRQLAKNTACYMRFFPNNGEIHFAYVIVNNEKSNDEIKTCIDLSLMKLFGFLRNDNSEIPSILSGYNYSNFTRYDIDSLKILYSYALDKDIYYDDFIMNIK